jgi:predicted component of type VI protein secretion system
VQAFCRGAGIDPATLSPEAQAMLPLAAGMKAGLDSVLGQLSPVNVSDQFEQGRARQLAPGQDPRPRYWEHYSEFYRLLTQQTAGTEEMPRSFTEAFELEYARVRGDLRQKRPT